ncbi:MAG: MBOAT family O-acyltransferase [Oscillospiraceae bacterium]
MPINSTAFLLFLAMAVADYYLTPKKYRYLVLLAASVYFYLAYSVRAALCLLATIVTTYAGGLLLGEIHRREKEALAEENVNRRTIRQRAKHRRRMILGGILILNFSTLALFKYLDAWLGDLNGLFALLGIRFTFRPLELLLPLGISFYIFQTSGYLIDVYRGRVKPERSFLKYTLYASYFPQMIQGPINRFDKLAPQLTQGNDFNPDNLKYGIQLMIWGMLKKVFLADPLAGAVSEIYGNYTSYSGAVIFLGAALYCVQLYCDFSGGTDLVRGASQLFGVEMAENFRRPYFARSVDEFWRRWHISLGEWMKDYLFYPLALSGPLSRVGKKARNVFGLRIGKLTVPCIATLTVFLAVGIWQGPGWSNIAYGLWNGGLMCAAMLCESRCKAVREQLHLTEDKRWFRVIQVLRTCLLVVIGRYFSRSDTLRQALSMLWRTVRYFGWSTLSTSTFTGFGLDGFAWLRIALAAAVLLTVSVLQERGVSIRKALEQRHWLVQFALLFGAVLLLVAFVYLNTDYTAIMFVYETV